MKIFFDRVRADFGNLSQSQVDGFNTILRAFKVYGQKISLQHQAYILATAWHEVDKTMQPIEEYGKGKGKPYGKPTGPHKKAYYGRGLVQLTWLENYEKATKRLRSLALIGKDVDLVKNPELALRPDIAAWVLVIGCMEGWFTGKSLADYRSYKDMRRVVNGTDKAEKIAGYANLFESALRMQQDRERFKDTSLDPTTLPPFDPNTKPVVVPPPPDVAPKPVEPIAVDTPDDLTPSDEKAAIGLGKALAAAFVAAVMAVAALASDFFGWLHSIITGG